MILSQRNTDALHWNRSTAFILLLGLMQLAFADESSDPSQGLTEGTYLDLSLPSEVIDSESAASRPDLSGTWVLDPSASDDPKEVLEATRSSSDRSHSGGRGDGGFGRRSGGRESRHKSGDGRLGGGKQSGSGAMADLSAKKLEIVHQDPLLMLTTKRQGTRKLYTDFRGASVSAMGGMDQQIVTGGWEDDVLVIEITTKAGSHIVQRLRLLAEPRRLERVTELSGQNENGKAIQVKQVFLPKSRINEENAPQDRIESSHFNWMED